MYERLKSLLGIIPTVSSTAPLFPRPTSTAENVPKPQEQVAPKQSAKIISPESRQRPQTGISFVVDDVVTTQRQFSVTTLRENLELRSGSSILIMPDQNEPALAPGGFLRQTTNRAEADRHPFVHPLIEAVHLAFSEHRPLVVSPDCIWLTIVQGFAHHLHENAESLRGRIVAHDGRKNLTVRTESLDENHWPEMISQFSEQIRRNSDPVLHETLLCNFSTTTPKFRTAFEVALMDVYQRYFEYNATCVCGIPTVTLEGTPDDWQRIRDRIEVLATFDLQWWTSRLTPILDQFVTTSMGSPDRAFWQAIYKPARFYFTDSATGWIADLFPYLCQRLPRLKFWRNNIFGTERRDWLPVDSNSRGVSVALQSFPSGLSCAPVKIQFSNSSQSLDVVLMAGFFGVFQDPGDHSLSPEIAWAVVWRDPRAGLTGGEDGELRQALEQHRFESPKTKN
jgi:hypothetical protein